MRKFIITLFLVGAVASESSAQPPFLQAFVPGSEYSTSTDYYFKITGFFLVNLTNLQLNPPGGAAPIAGSIQTTPVAGAPSGYVENTPFIFTARFPRSAVGTYTISVSNGVQTGTSPFTVTIPAIPVPNTWDGTSWSEGSVASFPQDGIDLIIDANYTVNNTSLAAKNLTVNSGDSLILRGSSTLSIIGDTINNQGTIYIPDSATTINLEGTYNIADLHLVGNPIVFGGSLKLNGRDLRAHDKLTLSAQSSTNYARLSGQSKTLYDANIQAWIDVSTPGYHYLGAPPSGTQLADFNEGQTIVAANNSTGTIWSWNASSASWEAPSSITDTAVRGKGYAIYAGTNASSTFLRATSGPIEVNGDISVVDVSVPLAYNDGQSASVGFAGGSSQAAKEGWNLLANPYANIYDWDGSTGQALPTGTNNAFYIKNGGSFTSYVSGVGTNGGKRYIAPFQAFWVQTTNSSPGNFVFNRWQAEAALGGAALLKTSNNSTVDGAMLTVSNHKTSDELFIGFDAQATPGFDTDLDARKLLNTGAPNLFTKLYGESYSICRIPKNGLTSFPLTLDDVTDGASYSFHIDVQKLSAYSSVKLEDKMLGIVHDLKATDYNFSHSDGYGPDRFVLHFGVEQSVGDQEIQSSKWYAFATENGLQLELGDLSFADVEIFDISGRRVFTGEGLSGMIKIPMAMRKGIYVIRVRSGALTESRKIVR